MVRASTLICWVTIGWVLVLAPSMALAESPPPDLTTPPVLPPGVSVTVVPPRPEVRRQFPDLPQVKVAGSVRLLCQVTVDGHLESCTVLSETPAGYGLGQAALATSSKFRMRPRFGDGRPTAGAKIVIPVTFQPPGTPPPGLTLRPAG